MGIASFAFAQTLAGKSFTRRKEQGASLLINLSGVSGLLHRVPLRSLLAFSVQKKWLARIPPKN